MLQRLSELKIGVEGVIQQFDGHAPQLALMEMGCIPGEKVSVAAIAPLGDPIAVKVSGYTLSMRKKEAALIWVKLA